MAQSTRKQPPKLGRDLDSSYAEQDRREQRNMDDQAQSNDPKPNDPDNPASKPHGTTADQVANMESEGQAQEPVEPDDQDATATTPPGHQKHNRTTL
jgi:hypothetical protein